MFHKEEINGATLYLGNALEILPTLPRGCVDLTIVDSPYDLTSGGKSSVNGGCLSAENYKNDGKIVTSIGVNGERLKWDDFPKLVFDVMAERGHFYMMMNNIHIEDALRAAREGGFYMHNFLRWGKKVKMKNRWYMKSNEYVYFGSKGKAFRINDCSADQNFEFYQMDVSANYTEDGDAHPTEKPVALYEHYIGNSSQPGETVMDCFMGTGTGAVAAIKMGRKFIGVEYERKWFDVACRRAEEAQYTPQLVDRNRTSNRKAQAARDEDGDERQPDMFPKDEELTDEEIAA